MKLKKSIVATPVILLLSVFLCVVNSILIVLPNLLEDEVTCRKMEGDYAIWSHSGAEVLPGCSTPKVGPIQKLKCTFHGHIF